MQIGLGTVDEGEGNVEEGEGEHQHSEEAVVGLPLQFGLTSREIALIKADAAFFFGVHAKFGRAIAEPSLGRVKAIGPGGLFRTGGLSDIDGKADVPGRAVLAIGPSGNEATTALADDFVGDGIAPRIGAELGGLDIFRRR